jgi:hypothetical protein
MGYLWFTPSNSLRARSSPNNYPQGDPDVWRCIWGRISSRRWPWCSQSLLDFYRQRTCHSFTPGKGSMVFHSAWLNYWLLDWQNRPPSAHSLLQEDMTFQLVIQSRHQVQKGWSDTNIGRLQRPATSRAKLITCNCKKPARAFWKTKCPYTCPLSWGIF